MFDRLGWPLAGFVPPAWLASPGTRAALARCHHRFTYVTVRSGIFHLPDWRFERTANLWYSPDSALRRAISRCAIAHELSRGRDVPLLRMSLHPQDARVRPVLDHWRRLVVGELAERRPVTKREWVRVRAPQWAPRAVEVPSGLAAQDGRVSPARATS
jgi:predicted deacetylase